MADNKISNMPRIEAFEGDEIVPLVKNGSNYAATFDALREYFKDSSLVIFSEIDDSNPEVLNNPLEGYYPFRDIVYLPSKKAFVERAEYRGETAMRVYTTAFSRRTDYMDGDNVRTDRVFFCAADKEIYAFNGSLHNLFDTVRINAMTEEEFSKLENPIEGAFYATYE